MTVSATNFSGFAPVLTQGAAKLGVELAQPQSNTLLRFLALLDKWNKAFNLSAVRDPRDMLSRHLLDSLSLLPLLRECRGNTTDQAFTVLDVGTGPGLPGIPLAICMPDTQFVLLDSNGKKTRFVFQACVELGLKNVQVENARIENYQSDRQVDIVVSRAFASLSDFVLGCDAVATDDTRLIAMKGQYPADEIAAVPAHWQVLRTHEIRVPGSEGERHFIELTRRK